MTTLIWSLLLAPLLTMIVTCVREKMAAYFTSSWWDEIVIAGIFVLLFSNFGGWLLQRV
jgi:hypothetical protein